MPDICTKPPSTRAPRQCPRTEKEYFHPDRRSERRLHNDEWLSTLSHELRSPLATIVNALELLSSGLNESGARRARDIAERQALNAMQIIEDLFDLSSHSRGKLSLRKAVVNLAEIVAGATETTNHLLTARKHWLTVSLPPEPLFILADPLRLEQVLTNLLANAAKFTDPGGHIRLAATAEAGEVVLRVRDNGRGIAPELLPRVFDLYMQAPDLGVRRPSGLGLGLALVKSLVELHGGRITATSGGLGTGSEFIVRLPAHTADL
jgi:signal transduction histidine kinase